MSPTSKLARQIELKWRKGFNAKVCQKKRRVSLKKPSKANLPVAYLI